MITKLKPVLFVIIIFVIILLIAGYDYSDNDKEQVKNVEQIEQIEQTEQIDKVNNDDKKEEVYVDVWTTANVNVREKPQFNSDIIDSYNWNTNVVVAYINERWAKVKGIEYYLNRDYISENPAHHVNRKVPDNTMKTYMDYRRITSKVSRQYKLQQSLAYTGNYGIRMVNGRYCVAVGSYYTTTIGQYIDIELENGSIIHGILADCKTDEHTDSTNRFHPDGSVVEFVVDTDYLDSVAMRTGDISYLDEWNSKVVNIKVYDKIESF